jgi:hypothetical protein
MVRSTVILACACAGCLFPDLGGLTGVDASFDVSSDAADASATCVDPTVIAGNSDITNRTTDNTPAPYIDAYELPVVTSARAGCAWIYLAATPPPAFQMGVYADAADGGPSTLLAQTNVTSPLLGWNAAPLDKPIDVKTGAPVWLGWTVTTGNVTVKVVNAGCTTPGVHTDKLDGGVGTLPTTFNVTSVDNTYCSPAAYLGK